MYNAPFLHIGTEANRDLVEVAAQNGAVPDGSAVVDHNLAGEDDVGRHISIDGDLGGPLAQRYDLSLTPVVPFHSIGRLPDDRSRWGRVVDRSNCFSRESPARKSGGEGARRQPSGNTGYSCHFLDYFERNNKMM